MIEDGMPEFLRPRDVAQMFDVDNSTVRTWIKSGLLQSIKTPGGQYRIRRVDAEALLDPQPPQEPVAA
jgi:excisionase family DNA binding protein